MRLPATRIPCEGEIGHVSGENCVSSPSIGVPPVVEVLTPFLAFSRLFSVV